MGNFAKLDHTVERDFWIQGYGNTGVGISAANALSGGDQETTITIEASIDEL